MPSAKIIHKRAKNISKNYLVAIALDSDGLEIRTLASGADFYAYPSLSPDGHKLCWNSGIIPICWDCTQLWQANISEAGLRDAPLAVGADNDEAIFQPRWSPDNRLFYVSDKQLVEYLLLEPWSNSGDGR